MLKLVKNWYKKLAVLLLVLLVALVASVPAGVSITLGGVLSLDARVALAVNNPSNGEFAEQVYTPGDEVVEKRTRNSKTHSLGNNKYSWDGTIGAIHYEENGWQEIDNIFESAPAPWDWQMLHAGYHIRVKEDFTAGQIIEFEKQDETVQFQPMALEWTNDLDQIQPIAMPHDVSPVITNLEVDLLNGMLSHQGTIRWNDAYGEGIDFEWKATATRLEKILEVESLDKLPTPEQYILDGDNPVLRLNLIFDPSKDIDIYVDGEVWDRKTKVQTFKIIEFRKDGVVLWGFVPLRYWGSIPELEENEGQSIATLEKRGNKLYTSIRVPYEWLQNAAYPVFIDDSITEEVGASANHGRVNGVFSSGDTAQYFVGQYNSEVFSSFSRFTTVEIPNGATIDNGSYLSVYTYWQWGDGGLALVAAHKAENPAAPTTKGEFYAATRTTAKSAQWNPQNAGGYTNSPELKTIIGELVSAYDYSDGTHAIVIFTDDDGSANGNCSLIFTYSHVPSYPTKLHIEYTVGAPAAEVVPTTWEAGILEVNATVNTAINFFTVTNTGSGAIDIEIMGIDAAGGDDTWDLADDGSPGENIFGLYAGLDDLDDNFDIIIKEDAAYNTLVAGLAESATQDWGIKLYMPTSVPDYDGQEMTIIVTLIVSAS